MGLPCLILAIVWLFEPLGLNSIYYVYVMYNKGFSVPEDMYIKICVYTTNIRSL